MRLIVADIGGTNARFAVSSQGETSLCHITHLRCADFVGFEDAFERFLTGLPCDEQIAEDNDQEERAKAAWFFVPVGLACLQAICCKSVAKQVSVHNSLLFDGPG